MPSEGVRRKEVETDPSFFDDIALTKWLFSTSTGELADRHGVLRAPRCAPAGQGDTISLVLDADAGRLSVVVKRTRHPGTISESECTLGGGAPGPGLFRFTAEVSAQAKVRIIRQQSWSTPAARGDQAPAQPASSV